MERERFLALIEDFLDSSGMSPTAFSVSAVNDPRFISDLREGRSVGFKLVDKVKKYIQSQQKAVPKHRPSVNGNADHVKV